MKLSTLLFVTLPFATHAQTILLSGHTFGIAFEDTTLTTTNKNIIANDVIRLLTPSTNSAEYATYSTPSPEGYIGVLNDLEGPNYFPKPSAPRDIKLNSNNGLDIVVTKKLSDEYLLSINFLKKHQKAIDDAEVFASYVVTNKLINIPIPQFSNMLLDKEFAPGTAPTPELIKYAQELSMFRYTMPSILGFQLLEEGPGNIEYLWGVLPRIEKSLGLPIIYYQGQWYISWWYMQVGEQQW